jgi:hypothetical protein
MSNWKTILETTTIKTTSKEFLNGNQLTKTPWKRALEIMRNYDNIAWIDTFKTKNECFNYIQNDDYLSKVSLKNMQLYQITDLEEVLLIVY